ncbi:MAG: PKD domain-containing protein [Marinilabiliaceae bacterium]|nr:PKD domain-containing protein [Marinilabiliaceae bacterium]
MKKVLIPLFLIAPMILFSQTSKKEQRDEIVNNAKEIRWQDNTQMPSFVGFRDNYKLSPENATEYSKSFFTSDNVEFVLKNSHTSRNNKQFYRYFQTVNGYPVEFTSWHVHVKNNQVFALNGDIVDLANFETIFTISEKEALQIALNYIGAEVYMWQDQNEELILKEFENDPNATYFPSGIKVITPITPEFKNNKFRTAYKFNIYSIKPLDRKMVYVDAQTGEILFDLSLIHFSDAVGTAHTQYSGIQQINTFFNGTNYILRDNTRGNGIWTLNCQNTINYNTAVEFLDADNVWNNINTQLDQYATDAHYGTMSTYDYFYNVHGRNSIDNNGYMLRSYVHFNLIQYGYSNNINAFWNGQWMTYGDGAISQGITPLTTLDICGHEITHGLTTNTANLVYSYEPGALSESFSDIFGTTIEFYGYPEAADWLMGEKIGMTLRSMQNPKAYNQPDTYLGIHWYTGSGDNGGVHYNSGVLNYWFYLLCEGGSGTNDNGHAYNVTAIGMENAEQIAFKLLTEYLTPTSQYFDAYYLGMQATAEIFGGCSPETQAVGNAFYAVGVITTPYNNSTSVAFEASENIFCSVPAQVTFINTTQNGNTYLWNFGDGNTSTEINPTHIYENFGTYTVTLFADGGVCGEGTEIKENYIEIDSELLCSIIMPVNGHDNIEACKGIVYDNGGPTSNYANNSNSRLTIHSPGATHIVLNIVEFDIEAGWGGQCNYDWIAFHNGNSTSAPLINNTRYCNTTGNPPTISSTGEYITIHFSSDYLVTNAGYKIIFQCFGNSPVADFSVNTEESCNGYFIFTDLSTNYPESWEWDFGDGNTSYQKNPTHQYAQNGLYTVSLTAANNMGEDTIEKQNFLIVDMPEAPEIENIIACIDDYFDIELDLDGTAYWYENIENINPIHIGNVWNHPPIEVNKLYYLREVFDSKNIIDDNCASYFTEVLLIPQSCLLPPVAHFSVNTEESCNGFIVFTDESTNIPITWEWNFGDGNTSNLQNPTHQYSQNGIYSVTLTVSNNDGENTIQKTDFITVDMPEAPEIENITACSDKHFDIELDLEGTAYWYTDINLDYVEPLYIGNSMNHPPIEVETIYYIREVFENDKNIIGENCASYYTEVVLIPEICLFIPIADFSVNTEESCNGFIIFTDESTNEPLTWEWNFGDGNISDLQNPTHQYIENGTYSVTLTVSNDDGENTIQKEDFLTIEMPLAPENMVLDACNDTFFEIELDLDGIAFWYENKNGEEPIHIGNIWNHYPIEEEKIYYIRETFPMPDKNIEDYCASYYSDIVLIPRKCLESIALNESENIIITPNPSNGIFNIDGLKNNIEYTYKVTDISGKIISDKQNLDAGVIDISEYPDGVYFLLINTTQNLKTFKLLKRK